MSEGATSRIMAADRPCGKFYDFYSVISEYFGLGHVRDNNKEVYLVEEISSSPGHK
jgi:hypothetical protein